MSTPRLAGRCEGRVAGGDKPGAGSLPADVENFGILATQHSYVGENHE